MSYVRTLSISATLLLSFGSRLAAADHASLDMPYRAANLTERQAAAFVLDRLTFGARPNDVDHVLEVGLENWIAQQLGGMLPDTELATRLEDLDALSLSHEELVARFPSTGQIRAELRRFHDGVIPGRDAVVIDTAPVNAKIDEFKKHHGLGTAEGELNNQLIGQKVLRAIYSENQLREVMTDFWLNHFFASTDSTDARPWILSYEQEALRPYALGEFRRLLGAVTRHPAMRSYYSGKEQPAEVAADETTMGMRAADLREAAGDEVLIRPRLSRALSEIVAMDYERDLIQEREFWDETGPNREYAHALLTLQTLGPAARIDEATVASVARAFTGWTVMPIGPSTGWFATGLAATLEFGFVRDQSFLFRADLHDARPKSILGHSFPAGGGVDEGERVLDLLVAESSTAQHLARKLAVRFVSDEPSEALVDQLAGAFSVTGGNVAAVLEAMLESPEFWQSARHRSKIKTPLEYVVSALRATAAEVEATEGITAYLSRMGQALYAYEDESGLPDSGAYWLDPAALVQRLNFARHLTNGTISEVSVGSAAAAMASRSDLSDLAEQLLPGRRNDRLLDQLVSVADGSESQSTSTELITALIIASPEFQLR